MLRLALAKFHQVGLDLAAGGEHGLQRLLALIDIGAGIGQSLVERGDLGFEVDLARDAGLGEVFAAGCQCRADLVVDGAQIGGERIAAAGNAVFLGLGAADIGAGFVGSGVDLAQGLFDDGNLVDVLEAVDGGVRGAGNQAAHARQDAFVRCHHVHVLRSIGVCRHRDADFIGPVVGDEFGCEDIQAAGGITGNIIRYCDTAVYGRYRQVRRALDGKELVVERQACRGNDLSLRRGEVAQAEGDQAGRQRGVLADLLIGEFMQRHEIGAAPFRCQSGEDLEHPGIGLECLRDG
jgi:hypothetical protein